MSETQTTTPEPEGHPEACKRCRGKGHRWYGRGCPPQPCNACQGAGYRVYRASAEERAHTREVTAARKARKLAESVEAFKDEYPKVWAWMERGQFEFSRSLKLALLRYGSLTDRQFEASLKWVR